jgi:hypothetical protein
MKVSVSIVPKGGVDPGSTAIKFLVVARGDTADYSGADVDDSAWATGLAPFANIDNPLPPQVGFPGDVGTSWPLGTDLWYRAHPVFSSSVDIRVKFYADDGATFWFNGAQVYEHITPPGAPGQASTFYREFTIPASSVINGQNVVAVRSYELYGEFSYFYFEMTQLP